MSKTKSLLLLVVLVAAILITYFSTKYANPGCVREAKKERSAEVIQSEAIYRLPTSVIPVNYELKIQPFLRPDDFYFNGSILVLLHCRKSTSKIQLHANDLEIHEQQVTVRSVSNGSQIRLIGLKLTDDLLTLKLDQNLRQNENYTLFIPFKGVLTTSLGGFYRSRYFDSQANRTRWLAMTHFEALSAREAFPCFDEPALKATFDIEITHWANMTSVSNMPNTTFEVIDSDWARTKFEKTVKMSTYLVAFAVGDFAYGKQERPTVPEYRFITRPSEREHTQKALYFGPRVLAHFEKYFGIQFPLPKIDTLATPDFSAGAMENFGLISYREAYVLYEDRLASAPKLYALSVIVAHELAHQWSGNLVTPKWWDDIWLNEGFATYMKYEGINAVRPNWNVWEKLVLDEIQDALALDALKSTHAVSVKLKERSEITAIFDRISYGKGCSIIHMMNSVIGIDTFRDGMHSYLEAFKYDNAEQDDLWRHLQAANDKNNDLKLDVKRVMDSWTKQEGYPLVTVTRDYASNSVRFSQKRFLLNGRDEEALVRTQYEVPITFTSKSEDKWEPNLKLWLHKTSEGESFTVAQLNVTDDEWLVANLQEAGFYRVTYDDRNWELLINQLLSDHTKIHRVNRAQILDDLFHLAENGAVEYSFALRALEYLKNEKDSLPWISVNKQTRLVNRMLRRTELYGYWQSFILEQVKATFERLYLTKFIDEDLQNGDMQKAVVEIACAYELPECKQNAIQLFQQFMSNVNNDKPDENPISPNIRKSVYCTAIANGGLAEWNFLYGVYLREENANERNLILKSLACSRVPWILVRYLNWTFNESNTDIRRQDNLFVFASMASQNYGKDIAFHFLRENWLSIHRIHGESKVFGRMVNQFDTMNSEFELNQIKEFYQILGNRVGLAKSYFLQTIDQIEANLVWVQKYQKEIGDFLTARQHS